MKSLIRMADPFGMMEKLMLPNDGTASRALPNGNPRQELDIGSMVDLLRDIHERRARNSPLRMDSPGSVPVELLGHSVSGSVVDDSLHRAKYELSDHGKWPSVQQELRLWCLGGSTGGKFVVINEKDTPEVFRFDCVRPIGISRESWSAIDISLDFETLELSPGGNGIVSIRLEFHEFRPATEKLEFCLDIRGVHGDLVSKLWVEVTFPAWTERR